MIEISLKNIRYKNELLLNSDRGKIGFTVKGHSGTGIKGNDVLCSAVSAIVQAAVVSINRVAGIRQKIEQRDGFLKTVLEIDRAGSENVFILKIVLSAMIVGLEEIVKSYPESLKIIYV